MIVPPSTENTAASNENSNNAGKMDVFYCSHFSVSLTKEGEEAAINELELAKGQNLDINYINVGLHSMKENNLDPSSTSIHFYAALFPAVPPAIRLCDHRYFPFIVLVLPPFPLLHQLHP